MRVILVCPLFLFKKNFFWGGGRGLKWVSCERPFGVYPQVLVNVGGGGGGLGSGRRVLKWVYHNSLRHSKLGIIWLCPPLCEVTRVRQATTGFAPEDFYLFTGKSV